MGKNEVENGDENGRDERQAKAFLQDAYALETEADTRAFYERWAQGYDTQLERGLRYIAPRILAETLARYQSGVDEAILDVGCGTGLTGCCLRELGFQTIDGIDFSPAMLDKAAEKRVYRKLIEADLNLRLHLNDAAYAAIISTGTFTFGHVGAEPIEELVRVLAPGGHFACTVHRGIWDDKGFARTFSALERAGAIHTLERRTGQFFENGEPEALYCVFRRL